ncbi:MAG: hypothetical protein C0P77_012010 [Thermoanaerobacterales bacterium]|nr:hypothetical protein [Thermoanaerobacterales bacterium]
MAAADVRERTRTIRAATRALRVTLAQAVGRRPERRAATGRRRWRRAAVLQSDIVGSTRLLRAAGDDYPELLVRHRRLIAAAVARRRGRFLAHAGDGTMAVFDRVDHALAAAVDAQRALGAAPWPGDLVPRVRMGVHVGEIVEVDGEPVGLAVHHGARVMAAARPGQVLVSPDAAAAAGAGGDGAGATVVDAGWHVLRDHDEPVRLGQVAADGLAVEPPAGLRIDLRDVRQSVPA